MKSSRKTLIFWVVVSLILLVTGITLYYKEKLSGEIEQLILEALQTSLGPELQIKSIEFHLLPTIITLKEVAFPKTKTETEKPLLLAQEINLAISRWSLLTEVLVITNMTFRGAEVVLIRDASGQFQWPVFPNGLQKVPAGEERKVLVRRINIEDSLLIYKDEQKGINLSLGELQASIRPGFRMKDFEVQFTAPGTAISYGDMSQEDLRVEGRFSADSDRIELTRLELRFEDDSRVNLNGNITNLSTAKPTLILHGNARLSSPVFQKARVIPADLSGIARFRFQIRGIYPDLQLQGNASFQEIRFKGTDVFVGEINFGYADQSLTIPQIKGEFLGGSLDGNVIMEPLTAPWAYKATLKIKDMISENIQPIAPQGLVPAGKQVSGEIRASGQGLSKESIRAEGWFQTKTRSDFKRRDQASAKASHPLFIGEALGPYDLIEAQLEIAEASILRVNTLMVSPASSINLEGIANFDGVIGFDVNLTTRDANEIKTFFGILPDPQKPRFLDLVGPLQFTGRLDGKLKSLALNGNLRADQMLLRGKHAGSLETAFAVEEEKLVLKRAVLTKDTARYDFVGEIDFSDTTAVRFSLETAVRTAPVGDVIDYFYKRIPIEALSSGHLKIEGSQAEFLVEANLDLANAELYGQHFETGKVSMEITRTEITFSNAHLQKSQTGIDGSGWLSFDQRFLTRLISEEFHLEDFDFIKQSVPDLRVDLSLEITGSGEFQSPEFHGQAKIKKLTFSGADLGQGRIHTTLMGRNLAFESSIEQTQANGLLRLEKDLPIRANLSFSELPLEPFLKPFYPELVENVSLMTSGQMLISGKILKPLGLHIEGTFTQLAADIVGYKVTNYGEGVLEFDGGDLQVKALQLRGEGTSLTVSGEAMLGKSLNLFLNGEADLNVFRLITDEFSYGKGKAYLVLKIMDEWNDPKITGGLTIQDGSLRSETLQQTLTITTMGLFFNQRQVVLETLEGKASGGELKATGKLELKNLVPDNYGLIVDLSGVRARLGEESSVIFDGNFVFQGNLESRHLRGEARIERAAYAERLDLTEVVLALQKRQAQPSGPTPFLGPTEINIHFFGRDNIRINNNLAKIPLEIDLFLKGTYDRPLLFGHVETKPGQGEIYFRRHVFKVQSGTLDFINPDRIAPVVNVMAATTIRTYQVEMNLTGRLDKGFNLGLTSDPPLSETDILALLTIGRTPEELAELPGTQATAAATSVPTSLLFDEFIEEKVKDITGIDRFQVEPYSTSSRAAAGPRLTVQKRLLDDKLTVTYISAVDPAEEEMVKLEYQLGRSISLVGERDEKGRLGGDIKFRLEFR